MAMKFGVGGAFTDQFGVYRNKAVNNQGNVFFMLLICVFGFWESIIPYRQGNLWLPVILYDRFFSLFGITPWFL